MEAGIAWLLARLDPAEEGLECAVDAQHDILQDLAVDLAVLRQIRLDRWKLGLLLIGGDRDATLLPRLSALTESGVVDVAAEHEGTIKHALVLGGGLELVLKLVI